MLVMSSFDPEPEYDPAVIRDNWLGDNLELPLLAHSGLSVF
jgi:hypothetical protein